MHIDVYHDIACPWCRIGKRHLALALAQWSGEPATVTYRPFFLNAEIPPEGYDFRAYMTAKGGGSPDLERWFAAPRRMGAMVGLTFRFEAITHAPNTLLAHTLVELTPDADRPALIDALYAAYFEHGRDIGAVETLAEIAALHGHDREDIAAQLHSSAASEQVLAQAHDAQQIGVTGVPLFVFAGRYALSGAQPPEVLLQVMSQVVEKERLQQ